MIQSGYIIMSLKVLCTLTAFGTNLDHTRGWSNCIKSYNKNIEISDYNSYHKITQWSKPRGFFQVQSSQVK